MALRSEGVVGERNESGWRWMAEGKQSQLKERLRLHPRNRALSERRSVGRLSRDGQRRQARAKQEMLLQQDENESRKATICWCWGTGHSGFRCSCVVSRIGQTVRLPSGGVQFKIGLGSASDVNKPAIRQLGFNQWIQLAIGISRLTSIA